MKKQIKPFNPKILLDQKVEKISEINKAFEIITSNEKLIQAKCIIIAAGNGAFISNKPPIDGIEEFEEKTIFYNVKNKQLFDGKKLAIAGGGDSYRLGN